MLGKMMIFAECPLYVRSTYESLQRDSCVDHLCPVQPWRKGKTLSAQRLNHSNTMCTCNVVSRCCASSWDFDDDYDRGETKTKSQDSWDALVKLTRGSEWEKIVLYYQGGSSATQGLSAVQACSLMLRLQLNMTTLKWTELLFASWRQSAVLLNRKLPDFLMKRAQIVCLARRCGMNGKLGALGTAWMNSNSPPRKRLIIMVNAVSKDREILTILRGFLSSKCIRFESILQSISPLMTLVILMESMRCKPESAETQVSFEEARVSSIVFTSKSMRNHHRESMASLER